MNNYNNLDLCINFVFLKNFMSRFLKAIDLYGKIPKGLAEPTDSGAIVSIVTMSLISLMILTEVIV